MSGLDKIDLRVKAMIIENAQLEQPFKRFSVDFQGHHKQLSHCFG